MYDRMRIGKQARGMNKQAIPEMLEWCRKIGYEVRAYSILLPMLPTD